MRGTIFDHAPTGLALLSSGDGQILEANEAFAGMVGLTLADVRGRTLPELVAEGVATAPLDIASVLDGAAQALTGDAWFCAEGAGPQRYRFRAARTPATLGDREHVVLCLDRDAAREPDA
ncbi:MAG: hypothetical protein JWM31_2134, partial [Solirubrobacterales bacterium]|nr:hypothetical protein [Solirubrobacterales bacterium]